MFFPIINLSFFLKKTIRFLEIKKNPLNLFALGLELSSVFSYDRRQSAWALLEESIKALFL